MSGTQTKEPKGVRLDHISKIYKNPKTGQDFYAVHDVELDIKPGTFVTLLGPSGCGKTTTLRMIAGFESPDEGEIYLGGEPINELTPNKRDTAMVFQSYALFPHYNVFDNVAYGLKLRGVPKNEIKERVTNILEPLSNLDAKLRVQMRTEIRRIQQALGITAIYVTHDQSEAMAISDNIILMKGGVIAQMGSPTEIYYHPNSEFVADFIGECNFLPCTVTGREGEDVVATVYGYPVKVRSEHNKTEGAAEIVLRPEAIEIADEGLLPCKVELSCFMGSYQNYHVRVGDTLVKIADNCPIGKKTFQVGDDAFISFRSECAHLLET